jgi:predicted GNAT family acetyltransferase
MIGTRKMLQLRNDKPTAPLAPELTPSVEPLKGEHEVEVLDFLAAHPLLTFVMSGWIKDNGLVSPLNRGDFYGCRNTQGELQGVALIGHITLFETNSEATLAAFACLTQNCESAYAVMGEESKVSRFLNYYYTQGGPEPRLICRELLFEQRNREALDEPVVGLRRATTEELEQVITVHAEMALEETGVNPLKVDPVGFRDRCARRIQQGRVWVSMKDNQLMFKADVISDLPEVTYLEGLYVSPEERGNGFGARCVRQLTNNLLTHSRSACLLAKDHNSAAHDCYRKAGYTLRESYQTLFLQ